MFRGFGYIEFDTLKAKDAAMMSMNNYNLSGKQLRVGMVSVVPSSSHLVYCAAVCMCNIFTCELTVSGCYSSTYFRHVPAIAEEECGRLCEGISG